MRTNFYQISLFNNFFLFFCSILRFTFHLRLDLSVIVQSLGVGKFILNTKAFHFGWIFFSSFLSRVWQSTQEEMAK